MRVEIPDRQFLHLREQFAADREQYAVGHADHQPVIGEYAQHARQIQAGHHGDGVQQAGEIPGPGQFHGFDVIVDDHAQEQGCLRADERVRADAEQREHEGNAVTLADVGEQAFRGLAASFFDADAAGCRAAAARAGASAAGRLRLTVIAVLAHRSHLPSSGIHILPGKWRWTP